MVESGPAMCCRKNLPRRLRADAEREAVEQHRSRPAATALQDVPTGVEAEVSNRTVPPGRPTAGLARPVPGWKREKRPDARDDDPLEMHDVGRILVEGCGGLHSLGF